MENTIINKYVNGKIYKITNNINNECYVGSTIKELHIIMKAHISNYKLWLKHNCIYTYITSYKLFNLYGLESCKIELLETYSCLNKIELNNREGYYIKILNSVNKIKLGITRVEQRKIYRYKNLDTIKEKAKLYYLKIKELKELKELNKTR
jgi:hypothetical protein